MKLIYIITAILVLIALGMWWLSRLALALLQPPSRITLTPAKEIAWCEKALEAYRPVLESLGFDEIGTFRVSETKGFVLTAFTQTFQGICAVVYDHPVAGKFVDMVSVGEDERSMTVSSAPAGEELDQPPGHEKIFDKTLGPRELYDLLLRRRPEGPYKRFDASNFVIEFETAYAKEMDWRLDRGGVTEEEVRRSAEIVGVTSEKKIRDTTEELQKQYAEQKEELEAQTTSER